MYMTIITFLHKLYRSSILWNYNNNSESIIVIAYKIGGTALKNVLETELSVWVESGMGIRIKG